MATHFDELVIGALLLAGEEGIKDPHAVFVSHIEIMLQNVTA